MIFQRDVHFGVSEFCSLWYFFLKGQDKKQVAGISLRLTKLTLLSTEKDKLCPLGTNVFARWVSPFGLAF